MVLAGIHHSSGAPMAETYTTVAVLGLGAFGSAVAKDLASFGHHVVGIDIDEETVNLLADDIPHAMIADARNEDALRDAGVDQCDVVVIAIGDNLEANIVSAMNARLLGVKQVWAKSASRTHQRILKKIGVDHLANPDVEIAHRVAQKIHNPHVTDYMAISGGITAVSILTPAALDGKSLSSLDEIADGTVTCVAVYRDGDLLTRDAEESVAEDDILLLVGRRGDLQAFGERYCA